MKTLFALFKRRHAARDTSAKLRFEAGGLQAIGDVPRYPPFTEGLPAATPAQLLATQQTLIRQLLHELALPDEINRTLVEPLLESYAAFVHLIPASRAHHHRGAGGLLRHGLEVALWATRDFHGHIIDGHDSGERRKVLEPRWRLAVCISALCHDLGKPAYDLQVTDASGRLTWDVYGGLLCQWMADNNIDRYYIRWRSRRQHKTHERFSHLLTMRVIPRQVLSYLNEGDPRIIAVMHETIAGHIPKGSARIIHDLIMKADQRSVQRDLKGQRLAEGDQALGVPVAKYIVDAMKRLIHDGTWRANQPDQPLWVSNDSLFIDWLMAVPQITRLLEKDQVSGIPKAPDSIAESLADYDMIKVHATDNGGESFYVLGCPEKLATPTAIPRLQMVEINGLEVLFDGPHPAPVKVHVGNAAIASLELANAEQERKKAQERSQKKNNLLARMTARGESRPTMPGAPKTGESDGTATVPHADAQVTHTASASQHNGQKPPAAPNDHSHANVPENTPDAEQSQQWLQRQGYIGQMLRICAIPGFPASLAFRHGDRVALPYPQGMEQFGEQRQENLAAMKSLLEPHPTVPDKPTHKIEVEGSSKPVNALLFNDETSAHLLTLAQALTFAASQPPAQEPNNLKAPRTADKGEGASGRPPSKKTNPTGTKAPSNSAKPEKSKPPKQQDRERAVARAQAFFNAIHEGHTPFTKIPDPQGRGVWVPYRPALDWYVEAVVPGTKIMEVIPALFKAGVATTEIPEGQTEKYILVLENELE